MPLFKMSFFMTYPKILIFATALTLAACSNEPKESDKLLSDYKNKQLDKAKQVEDEMKKRIDNLDKELQNLEQPKKDDPR